MKRANRRCQSQVAGVDRAAGGPAPAARRGQRRADREPSGAGDRGADVRLLPAAAAVARAAHSRADPGHRAAARRAVLLRWPQGAGRVGDPGIARPDREASARPRAGQRADRRAGGAEASAGSGRRRARRGFARAAAASDASCRSSAARSKSSWRRRTWRCRTCASASSRSTTSTSTTFAASASPSPSPTKARPRCT